MACKPFQKKDAIHRFDAGMVSFFLPSAMHKYRPQATMFRIVNALIGAARDCVCCVERMCIRKLLRVLVIDLKKVDRICCSELYDRCCRCACCTEESIDLAVF